MSNFTMSLTLTAGVTYLLAIVYMCHEIQDILEAGLHTDDTENLVLYKKKKMNGQKLIRIVSGLLPSK